MATIDYLTSLAPEGETLLLTKQVPKKKLLPNGKKGYAYPAMLPNKFIPNQPFFANTGSFILSRLGVRLSAAEVNCDHVLCMILDDIGTKVTKPIPLPPTWIVETSPGNFQYGYTFQTDAAPTCRSYAALIVAIAGAGYTDPGAINPVRNFRIAGSLNLKNSFVTRLVELHPEREYTPADIITAFEVVPGEAGSPKQAGVDIADDGKDDVFAWLRENKLVLSNVNSSGWAGVQCPNHAEHTDGNLEGRYMPATRAYCCLHGHCQDWHSEEFLAWVAEMGGPEHAPGLRDDLLASVMAPVLDKLTPSDAFQDDAAKRIADVERQELGRVQRSDWYKRFAYVQLEDAYFDLQTREVVRRQTFNATFRHIDCRSINGGRKVEASICFDENRQSLGAPSVYGLTYAAGESVMCEREGQVYANTWINARPAARAGNVFLWLEHCERMIPDKTSREHAFNMMAHKVQHPGVKINHAALHAGLEGSGKDTVWAPMLWAVTGPYGRNRGLVDNEGMASAFHYHLESEILVIPELREPDAKDRRAFANKLKPIVAAPPEMLTINRKNLAPYSMLNRVLVLAFSNSRMPITLETQDRRWFCIWSDAPRMSSATGKKIWDWYKSGGFEAIAAWLYARDVSRWNPAEAPPVTDYKLSMIENGMSGAEAQIVDMIQTRAGPFEHGVIASPFHRICERLSGFGSVGHKVVPAILYHALQEAGWHDKGRIKTVEHKTYKQIFCAPELTELPKSELYKLAIQPTAATLCAVK